MKKMRVVGVWRESGFVKRDIVGVSISFIVGSSGSDIAGLLEGSNGKEDYFVVFDKSRKLEVKG